MKLLKTLATSASACAVAFSMACAAPVVDGGWYADELQTAGGTTDNSPYAITLTKPAWFRITDAFLTGDDWQVFNFGSPLLDPGLQAFPAPFGDNADADDGWTSVDFESGEILLGVGSYRITIAGDGGGGLPAGVFTRLDTVPVPAALPLMAAGMGLFGFLRRRRQA